MTLTLTSHDQARIRRAQNALLSPLEYETTDAWRADVNDQVKRVVGADKALFMLPGADGPRVYSKEFELPRLNEYPKQLQTLDVQYSIWKSVVRLGVVNRAMFWGSHIDQYYRSSYYNEYVMPIRGFHGVSMAVALGGAGNLRDGVFNEETVSQIVVHHDKPTRTPFGERGIGMLRLLYPAFLSGVRTLRHLQSRRSALLRTCDASDTAILVVDRSARIVHRTPALRSLLISDFESDRVETAMKCVAHRVVWSGPRDDAQTGSPAVVVQTSRTCYRVYGVRPTRDLMEVGAAALVLVKPVRSPLASLEQLQDQFGLTPRQAEVAQLLARRKTNPEIADALCISPHTARHHTEAVMEKLNVSCRRDVHRHVLWRV